MEKKKLLLVSVSVGLFLVIIIGVSVLAFSPKIYNAGEGSGVLSEGRSPVVPGQTDGQDGVGNMPPVSQRGKQNTAVENIIYVNGEKTNNVKLETEDGSPARTVINIQSAPQVVRVEPKVEFPPPPAAPPVVRKADPPPPKPSPPKPAPKPQTKRWWVQAGSFATKSHADEARQTLSGRGMASIVQDSTVNGKNWYRVRVGPWTTEKEAKHWLSLIKEIRGMEGSQIWENTR